MTKPPAIAVISNRKWCWICDTFRSLSKCHWKHLWQYIVLRIYAAHVTNEYAKLTKEIVYKNTHKRSLNTMQRIAKLWICCCEFSPFVWKRLCWNYAVILSLAFCDIFGQLCCTGCVLICKKRNKKRWPACLNNVDIKRNILQNIH